MQPVSEDMVRAVFSQRVEALAILLTISSVSLAAPIRVTDYAGQLRRNVKGISSRGNDYLFFPFSFGWGGAGAGELAREAQLTIGNTSGEIADALEACTDQPVITVEVIRVSAPDVVERAMTQAILSSTEEDGPKITGTIKPRQFDTEPACAKSYLPSLTPALF